MYNCLTSISCTNSDIRKWVCSLWHIILYISPPDQKCIALSDRQKIGLRVITERVVYFATTSKVFHSLPWTYFIKAILSRSAVHLQAISRLYFNQSLPEGCLLHYVDISFSIYRRRFDLWRVTLNMGQWLTVSSGQWKEQRVAAKTGHGV